jgi:cytochrome b561
VTETPTYDPVQRSFHWLMAALIFVGLGIGLYCAYQVPGTSPRRELLDIHKSIGMTVLVLLPLRFLYRLAAGEPPYSRPLSAPTHLAARAAHFGLYALMLAMPVVGYVDSAAGNYSLPWFGLFRWPRLVPVDKPLSEAASRLHYALAWVIAAVVALHVLAALWHRFVKRDEVLARMLPRQR